MNQSHANDAGGFAGRADCQTAWKTANDCANDRCKFDSDLRNSQAANGQIGYQRIKSVALANGQPSPAWLRFDAVSRRLTAQPGNAQVGTVALRVIAANDTCYISNSMLRPIYKGKLTKILLKRR